MFSIAMLFACLAAGLLCARAALPDKSPLLRGWLGLSFGVLLLMWLPALFAFLFRFTQLAIGLAFIMVALLCVFAYWWRVKRPKPLRGLDGGDRRMLIALACFALPLTLLSGFLQFTHTLRDVDGALHVGQATYGDLCMHLSIVTGLRGSPLPAEYTILPGSPLGYPLLTDAMSTTLYMLGMPLAWSMIVPGTIMSGLVFAGYLLLAREMTGKVSSAVIAGALLFGNGGLGFLYTFDLAGHDFSKIIDVFTGFYRTPANMPELNLRWSNLVADLLLPQRTFLGGWALLLPGLYFAREAFQKPSLRMFLLAALFGAALPLVHTHSFVALGLYSAGALGYALFANKAERGPLLRGAGAYLGIVLVFALPQLLGVTLRQAGNEGFMRLHFNWVNLGGNGFVDLYPWFWVKNLGLPLIAMVCALIDWNKEHRGDMIGAACIFIVAETVLFQPLDYDNNKLFYVWFLLMLPAAASWCVSIYQKLRGVRARVLIACLFLAASTLSGALSIARESVSDYELFSKADAEAAQYIEANTEPDAMFLTGLHHNNSVYALAGRKVVCGPSLFLYWHGLDFQGRDWRVRQFFLNPEANLALLSDFDVRYIVVDQSTRTELTPDENALKALFPIMYDEGGVQIYRVTEKAPDDTGRTPAQAG